MTDIYITYKLCIGNNYILYNKFFFNLRNTVNDDNKELTT